MATRKRSVCVITLKPQLYLAPWSFWWHRRTTTTRIWIDPSWRSLQQFMFGVSTSWYPTTRQGTRLCKVLDLMKTLRDCNGYGGVLKGKQILQNSQNVSARVLNYRKPYFPRAFLLYKGKARNRVRVRSSYRTPRVGAYWARGHIINNQCKLLPILDDVSVDQYILPPLRYRRVMVYWLANIFCYKSTRRIC